MSRTPLDLPFATIGTMFLSVCADHRDRTKPAFMYRRDSVYEDVGYGKLRDTVRDLAHGLRSIGISPGDRVGITAENRLEWVLSDFACTSIGIVDVPVFPILTDDQIEYIFSDAGVVAVICSNAFQLRKVIRAAGGIGSLEHIIVMDPEAIESVCPDRRVDRPDGEEPILLYSLEELARRGMETSKAAPEAFGELVARVEPDDLLTLIYTSGTTGEPKGVMLSHRNMVSNIKSAASVIPIGAGDTVLSYLPLCHAFERMAGYYTCFAMGATIAFAESIDTLATNLLEVRPTLMTTVPRFLERLRGRIDANARKGPERNRKIYEWAIATGRAWFDRRQQKGSVGPILAAKHALADRLVFSRIRERTGGRLRYFISGGAPLAYDVGAFFAGAGMEIIEGYGLTESSPVIAANPSSRPKLGTVGPPIPGVEVVIAEDGEIMARGENIMLGYYNNPKATAEVMTSDGWLHTGDVGEFDEDGYLRITDRKKHLFISSGGKNIAPGPIEEKLSALPYVAQILLLGDDLPYLAALIVPDFEALAEGLASTGHRQVDVASVEGRREVAGSEEAEGVLYREIRELQRDSAAYERVRRIALLPEEFTVENGMMTPTLKVKRKAVIAHYRDLIQQLYPDEEIG